MTKKALFNNLSDRDHYDPIYESYWLNFGELTDKHHEDKITKDPYIDQLLEKIEVQENPQFNKGYLDPNKHFIGNSV